jgi:hypothetical protein
MDPRHWPFTAHVHSGALPALICEFCGDAIQTSEVGVELFIGRSGHGEKSGRPMLVEDPSVSETISLHPDCLIPYAESELFPRDIEDSEEDDGERSDCCEGCGVMLEPAPKFCEACAAKLDPDSDYG